MYTCRVSGHIKRHVFYLKHASFRILGFCLRLQVKPTQLSPIDNASPYP
jgi:hypothetical protein